MGLLFSVIVPVYNCEKVLERCIDSILAQTCDNFEILLIDDGSSDSSGEICDKYSKIDSRVHVFHKTNGGVASARNIGLAHAQGKYCVLVDSDDYVTAEFLEHMSSYDDDLVILGYREKKEGESKEVIQSIPEEKVLIEANQEHIKALFINKVFNGGCAKRYSMDLVNQYSLRMEDILLGEDTAFVLEYLSHSRSIQLINKQDYYYVHYDQDTLSTAKISKERIKLVEQSSTVIFDKLKPLLGSAALSTMITRVGAFYKHILYLLAQGEISTEDGFIGYLCKQSWYKRVIREGSILEGENWKFRWAVKSLSPSLLKMVLRVSYKR